MTLIARFKVTLEERIAAGITCGDFVQEDPSLVVELFDAIQTRIVRWSREQAHGVDLDGIAGLLLRTILTDPPWIPQIRIDADRAIAVR